MSLVVVSLLSVLRLLYVVQSLVSDPSFNFHHGRCVTLVGVGVVDNGAGLFL